MLGEQYTQIKRPANRLTEKILGWFSWVFLLILTIVSMFIALVSFSNDTSIANLENTLNNNELVQQILANNDLSTTQFVIWLQNGVWAIIVYFSVNFYEYKNFVWFSFFNSCYSHNSTCIVDCNSNHSYPILYHCNDDVCKKR